MEPEINSASSSQKPSLLRGLLGILSFVFGVWAFSKLRTPKKNSSKSVHPQDTPEYKTQSGESTPGGSLMIQPPTDAINTHERRKRKTPWWEKAAVVIALGLLLANWFQGCQTKKAADAATSAAKAAKDSVNLQRKIVEGTSFAELTPSSLTPTFRNLLIVGVQNQGGVAATDISVSVQISIQQGFPRKRGQTSEQTFSFNVDRIEPKRSSGGHQYEIVGYTAKDLIKISKMQETLIIRLTATYDNGFGSRVTNTWCNQCIAVLKKDETASQPYWTACDQVPIRLMEARPPSEQWDKP